MKRLLALIAVCAIALAACSDPPPTTGTVENKRYIKSYTYYMSVCIAYSNGFCTGSMLFPMTEPDEWDLQLHNVVEKRTGWLPVDPQTYQQYGPGDQFPHA